MEFEVGRIFYVDGSIGEDDICCESGNAFIEVYDLDKTLVGGHVWIL